MKELFKPIDWVRDIPKDKYLVSNLGNVYNTWSDTYVKQTFQNGRKVFCLSYYDENHNRVRVTRHDTAKAVAIAFVPFPKGYCIDNMDQLWVNHKDMNVDNNMASNVEWCANINHRTGLCITVESLYMIYELLLKYYNNRTSDEMIDIIHNETGIRITEAMFYQICFKVHSEDSVIGNAFGLTGTSIREEALKKAKLLRPIVFAALKGEFKNYEDEKWVWLKYPNVQKDWYIISNYGRIYNKFDQPVTPRLDRCNHYIVNLSREGCAGKQRCIALARLVAYHFCDFPKGIEEHELQNVIIKYKDANSMNVQYKNLYWTTHQGATRHGIEINKVREVISYVKTLVDKGYDTGDITVLTNHKFGLNYTDSKYNAMITRSTECYNPTYKVLDVDPKHLRKHSPNEKRIVLTDDEVRTICKLLVQCNGNSNEVYRRLDKTLIPDICLSTVQAIRAGKYHRDISKEFFDPNNFRHYPTTSVEVCLLDGTFVKRYNSIIEMSEDSSLLSIDMPSYAAIIGMFERNGYIVLDGFIFRRLPTFSLGRKGGKQKTKWVSIILELDKDDNVVNVYLGLEKAGNAFACCGATISRWIKEGKLLENGNHLISMGRKIVPNEK